MEPREKWEVAFKMMHENGDDQLLIQDVFEDEVFEEYFATNNADEELKK